jgi:acetyl-CoA acetyltransferase
MREVYISEAGLARFGKRDVNLEALAHESVAEIKESSSWENIDALFFGNMSGEKFTNNSNLSSLICDHLGLSNTATPAIRIDTGSSSGAGVLHAGCLAVASGRYDNVLVVASEKMTHISTAMATKILAEVIDPLERQHGCTMTSLAAMVTRRYMHDYGLTSEELALVPVKNHDNGSKNPYAHFQKQITKDTVLKSKLVASPLRLYDCSPISDGAAALLLTSRPDQVKVIGIGHGTTHVALQFRNSLTSFSATKYAAKRAYEMAGKSPGDIDLAEVHDAFSSFEIINTEDLGFFSPGEGRDALVNGVTKLDGDLPINPSGGLKSRGHPVGVSGLAQAVELTWQLRNQAGARQVKGAQIGLCQSIGGLASNNLVTILEAV